MNILIPDIWLRKFLKTTASPDEIQRYVSLCGPSVERIYGQGDDAVYDVEVTGNRPDAMSVSGFAREAAAILPHFRITASCMDDPYTGKKPLPAAGGPLSLTLVTDPQLNPRWMSVIFDAVKVMPSPHWLVRLLELSGLRSINTAVDITNYLMRAYGQPAHVFDYDKISGAKMLLRASRKGETLITLDGKKHALPGGDIVIEDGSGTLIDLCGIMGGENSSVTETTKRVVLFLQTYDPVRIRKTSMALAHRTEAAALFEKGLDPELVRPVFARGMELFTSLTGAVPASRITDIYPKSPPARVVHATLRKIRSYIGQISAPAIAGTLKTLGFGVRSDAGSIRVTVPTFRRDVSLDVDVIEEIARIRGYHEITSTLPPHAPPETLPSPELVWEEQIKIRMRDWGYTETYTYSMISRRLAEAFGIDTSALYEISNPLSEEWTFMRPDVLPGMCMVAKDNLSNRADIMMFEISNIYRYRKNDLPLESPQFAVVWSGDQPAVAKGLAESIFSVFGIQFPDADTDSSGLPAYLDPRASIVIPGCGYVGRIRREVQKQIGSAVPLTVLSLDFSWLVRNARASRSYTPVPRFPPVIEDLSFQVPGDFRVGPFLTAIRGSHRLISAVSLIDSHGSSRTIRILFQDPSRNLTGADVLPVRNSVIGLSAQKFRAVLRQKSD